MPAQAPGVIPALGPTEPLASLELLAGAVAGRGVALAPSSGDRAWSDGATIHVPDSGERVAAVVVQAGLLAIGTLRAAGALARGRRGTAERYLVLEACRAAAVPRLLPASIARNVLAAHDGPISGGTGESLRLARSRERIRPPPEWFGAIRPVASLRRGAAVEDGAGPARPGQTETNDEDAEPSTQGRLDGLLAAPLGEQAEPGRAQWLRRRRSRGDAAGGQEVAVRGTRDTPSAGGTRRRLPAGLLAALAGPPVVGARYPEWDHRRAAHRPGWCTVATYDPPVTAGAQPLAATRDDRLRRELARLGTAPARRPRQRDGDTLDLAALVDAELDRRRGDGGDPRVFAARERTGRDLGVLVLLDATGSTGESAGGRSVFAEQREVAAAPAATMHELGDRVATYAFSSRGRGHVRFLRVKGFDDAWDGAARRRLAALEPGGFTRLGAGVRHATHLLTAGAGTPSLALVAIGDGLPYCEGYEGRYAREDSRMALREAMAAGVGCVSLGLRSSTDAAVLADVWGEVVHRELAAPGELAAHVRPLLSEAVGRAHAVRRPAGGRR